MFWQHWRVNVVNYNLLYIFKKLEEGILNVHNTKKWYMFEVMNVLTTLIWSLYIIYIYGNITAYPINMYSYCMSTKNKRKKDYTPSALPMGGSETIENT